MNTTAPTISIRQWDDPILKERCAEILLGDDLSWLKDLERACYENDGAGLAAPQIGIAKRAIFIRYGLEHGMILVNPILSRHSVETVNDVEGCLSYPEIRTPVARHQSVVCHWTHENGKRLFRCFSGFEARVLQHECDHLNGICRVGDAWRATKGGAE